MKFDELVELVGNEPVFETTLLLAGDANPADVRRQLSRWQKAGKIFQLRRGLYSLAPPFQKTIPHPFLIANRLAPGSYVSLQSALAHYGMIPEFVPVTTSVGTGRPAQWETMLGNFVFQHIQVDFFYGTRLLDLGGKQRGFIASPEKALLDLIYLTPGGDDPGYLAELRLSNLNRLDWRIMVQYAGRMDKPKLYRAVEAIRSLAVIEEEFVPLCQRA